MGKVNCNRARHPALAVGMIDRSTQHAEFASHGSGGAATGALVRATGLPRHRSHRTSFPESGEPLHGVSNPPWCRGYLPMFFRVVSENVGHEDLRGITRPDGAASLFEKLRERDFSPAAILSARAALPAAAGIGPDDVVGAALLKEAETWA